VQSGAELNDMLEAAIESPPDPENERNLLQVGVNCNSTEGWESSAGAQKWLNTSITG
jgi:hypothetical protein|tara:strand:+ start:30531 stop:30701 length:171 start_codon:yes stop_codon:yes gene_type:complete